MGINIYIYGCLELWMVRPVNTKYTVYTMPFDHVNLSLAMSRKSATNTQLVFADQ